MFISYNNRTTVESKLKSAYISVRMCLANTNHKVRVHVRVYIECMVTQVFTLKFTWFACSTSKHESWSHDCEMGWHGLLHEMAARLWDRLSWPGWVLSRGKVQWGWVVPLDHLVVPRPRGGDAKAGESSLDDAKKFDCHCRTHTSTREDRLMWRQR